MTMKKQFFMLMAALLLGSASAMAQSGNIDPARGDVNGDGIVDVGDINAVLKIMRDGGGAPSTAYKWHIGTTNYTKTIWEESEFNQTSTSPITSFTAVTSDPFTIWIVPNAWGTVSSMKVGGETRNPWITPVPWNPTLPSGYTAYYTTFSADTPITDITWEKTYKWYVGTEQPTAVDNPSTWRTSNKDAGFTETVSIGTGYTWFAYPDTWNYSAVDKNGNMFLFNAFVNNATKTSIPGYTLLKGPNMAAGDNITITFSK